MTSLLYWPTTRLMEMTDEETTRASVAHWMNLAGSFAAFKQHSVHVQVTAAAKQING